MPGRRLVAAGPSREDAAVRIVLRPADDAIDLHFDDRTAAEGFFRDVRRQNGFFVHLEHKLKQFQRLEVRAAAPDFRFDFTAEVVQLFPGPATFGTAFQLCGWDDQREAALERALAGEAEEPGDEPERQRVLSDSELSPMFKIKKMNVTQRFQLAMKASRIERQILVRDTSPQVLLGLLSHPRIEDKEVLEVVKSNYASSGILQRVGENRKWMQNPEIRLAVVRSPKTPPQLAMKHLDSLRTRELGTMAKGSWVRESLRKAALKLYMRRIGRPP